MLKIDIRLPQLEVAAPEKGEPRNTRQWYIAYFAKRINTERMGSTYPPISEKTIAVRYLAGIPTSDLEFLKKQCDGYSGPFSKCFFGSLKPRI